MHKRAFAPAGKDVLARIETILLVVVLVLEIEKAITNSRTRARTRTRTRTRTTHRIVLTILPASDILKTA
jgi:hypothetical protein